MHTLCDLLEDTITIHRLNTFLIFLLTVLEDVIEKLFSLTDVVLDRLEDPLLLLQLLFEVNLPLVVEVELSDRVLLEVVKFAKGVDLVLVEGGLLR